MFVSKCVYCMPLFRAPAELAPVTLAEQTTLQIPTSSPCNHHGATERADEFTRSAQRRRATDLCPHRLASHNSTLFLLVTWDEKQRAYRRRIQTTHTIRARMKSYYADGGRALELLIKKKKTQEKSKNENTRKKKTNAGFKNIKKITSRPNHPGLRPGKQKMKKVNPQKFEKKQEMQKFNTWKNEQRIMKKKRKNEITKKNQ